VAFSDDGFCVADAGLMRQALEYAKMFDKPIIDHCEDLNLTLDGVMHEGYYSMKLGLPGIPAASEEVMVARDLILAEMTRSHLHVAHVSARGSVELIRQAKARGVTVTAEVTPHHLALTDEAVTSFDPRYKMNPPLRSAEDAQALRAGLADGTIDCIVSDHAPHAAAEKDVEFSYAPFGVIGMESLLPVVIKVLIEPGILTWPQAVAAMTVNPARVLRLSKGTLAPGADADVTIIDPDLSWTIDAKKFHSKSRNCPFHGWPVTGKPTTVLVGGEVKQV
jgi:dihydroorotase